MVPATPQPQDMVSQALRLAADHIRRTSWNPAGLYLDDAARPCRPEEATSMCLQGAIRKAACALANGRDARYALITAAHYRLSQIVGGHIAGYERQPALTQARLLADLEQAAEATAPSDIR